MENQYCIDKPRGSRVRKQIEDIHKNFAVRRNRLDGDEDVIVFAVDQLHQGRCSSPGPPNWSVVLCGVQISSHCPPKNQKFSKFSVERSLI